MTATDIWAKVKEQLRQEMPGVIFDLAIEPINQAFFRKSSPHMALVTPDEVFEIWWCATNWRNRILTLLFDAAGRKLGVFTIREEDL